MILIPIITIGLIIGIAFLIRNAKTHTSLKNYFLVLLGGVVLFLFEPIAIMVTYGTNSGVGGGAIQIASTLVGLYAVGWSLVSGYKFLRQTKLKEKSSSNV